MLVQQGRPKTEFVKVHITVSYRYGSKSPVLVLVISLWDISIRCYSTKYLLTYIGNALSYMGFQHVLTTMDKDEAATTWRSRLPVVFQIPSHES